MKLIDILKETFLAEKIVKIPDEELAKIEKLYNYMKANKGKIRDSAPKDYTEAKADSKLNNYFKLNDLRGTPINVKIYFYNNPDDDYAALAYNKGVYINLSGMTNLPDFKDNIEHELVHFVDPKANDPNIANKLLKKGKVIDVYDFSNPDNLRNYFKDVTEFDAFTAPLVRLIKRNLDSTGEYKKEFMSNLNSLLSDIKTKDFYELVEDPKYIKKYKVGDQVWNTIRLLSNTTSWKGSDSKWEGKITEDFWNVLTMMQAWATKPTLYKLFLKRLGTEL
jgi:hypothetical protein